MSGQQHAPGRTLVPGKTRCPFYRRLCGSPGPVWTGGKSRPHRDSIPDRPARSQSLYRLSYRAHLLNMVQYNNINSQLDTIIIIIIIIIIILLIISISSTCFGRYFRPSSGALDCVYSLWYNCIYMHNATSCKHSLVLLRMGEIITRNMLSWLKLLITILLLLHLVGCLYYCISDARSHKHQIVQYIQGVPGGMCQTSGECSLG